MRRLVGAAAAVLTLALLLAPRALQLTGAEPKADAGRVREAFFYRPPQDGTTPEEVARRAGYVILTKNDEAYREELRAAGYRGVVLQYVLAGEAEGPDTASDTAAPCDPAYEPRRNTASYPVGDFCRLLHPNEAWFLHNGRGERLYSTQDQGRRRFYHMNPASAGWRAFLAGRLRRFVEGDAQNAPLGYDGIFLDNVELRAERVRTRAANSDGAVREFADDAAYRAAWSETLAEVSRTLRPRWPVAANLIDDPADGVSWGEYLPFLDGVMVEAFATGYSPERLPDAGSWERGLVQAERALAAEKQLIAVGRGADHDRLTFALASYLLVSDGRGAFFRYDADRRYETWERYPAYDLDLGPALGPRRRDDDGTWRRAFAGGSVAVNPERGSAEILPSAP